MVGWTVDAHDDFAIEFGGFPEDVREEIASRARLLEELGPAMGRPHCDTLKGSRYPNMKELRFSTVGGVWRLAFAFDPRRHAILLVVGDKSGVSTKRFYRGLIEVADRRFDGHLRKLEREKR